MLCRHMGNTDTFLCCHIRVPKSTVQHSVSRPTHGLNTHTRNCPIGSFSSARRGPSSSGPAGQSAWRRGPGPRRRRARGRGALRAERRRRAPRGRRRRRPPPGPAGVSAPCAASKRMPNGSVSRNEIGRTAGTMGAETAGTAGAEEEAMVEEADSTKGASKSPARLLQR